MSEKLSLILKDQTKTEGESDLVTITVGVKSLKIKKGESVKVEATEAEGFLKTGHVVVGTIPKEKKPTPITPETPPEK